MYRMVNTRAAQRLLSTSRSTFPSPISASRRLASTYSSSSSSSSSSSRSWKSSTTRWALAAAAVYFYNSTPAFAESRDVNDHPGSLPLQPGIDKHINTIHEERHEAKAANAANRKTPLNSSLGHRASTNDSDPEQPGPDPSGSKSSGATAGKAASPDARTSKTGPPAEGEGAEASSHNSGEHGADHEGGDDDDEDPNAGAYNPSTGEINWDCPCLGGMAHGPCGPQFRTAFSCFVHSDQDPKGVECIEHFRAMQDCFQEHPEVYGAEMEEADRQAEEELVAERVVAGEAKEVGIEGGEGELAGDGERVFGKDGGREDDE